MKWTTATALLLALSAGGAGVAVVTAREPKSQAEVLSSLRSQMGRPLFDSAAAIRELDDILEGDAGPLTVALERELLRARADVYESIGSIGRAREDVERILASYEADAASQGAPASAARIQSLTVEVIRLQSDEGELVAALERAERLSDQHPDHAEVWVLQGHLAERLAREGLPGAVPGLDGLLERVGRELSAERFEEAHELIVGLTALEPGDPEIQEIEARLTRAFEDNDELVLRWVLESVNEPRKWFSAARTAYTRALGVELTPAAVMRLADSLERAGQRDLAIKVQSIARRDPRVATEPAIAESFLRDLAAAGRTTEARDLITLWDWALGATTDFYRFAGELLFKSGELEALGNVAEGLLNVGEDTEAYWARSFFSPIANVAIYERQASRLATATEQLEQEKDPAKREELRTVRDPLSRWIDSFRTSKIAELTEFARDTINPEPFAGARKSAAFYAAEAGRLTGRANLARSSFSFALAEDPDGSAEAWANYAELLEAATLLKDAEEALSHAMSLDPALTAELAPRWFSLGEALLESNGTTLATLIDQCARQGTYLPSGALGASIQTLIAQDHLDHERYFFAIQAARAALETYPSLVPALDVIVGAELATPKRFPVAADIVERIELAGIDETVEGFLERLGAEGLEGELLLRAIHAAPARFGKAAAARWHLGRGEIAEAVDAFGGLDGESVPLGLRLLSARILMESGEHERALAALEGMAGSARSRPEIDLLRLRALLALGRDDAVTGHVRQIVAHHPLPGGAQVLLDAITALSRAGATNLAFGLVELLDTAPETRTKGFYARRVLVDLVLSDANGLDAARESILRAEPYLTDGTPEIAAIMLAVSEREWTSLPYLVNSIERSRYAPDSYQAAALALLGERLEDGARAAAAGLSANPHDPYWALLDAAASTLVSGDVVLGEWFGPEATDDLSAFLRGRDARNALDPRDAIALFLASRQPGFAPWTGPRLAAHVAETGSTIWGPLLQLEVASISSDDAEVARLLAALVRAHPRFGPGHDLAVERAEAAHPTEPLHPEVVRARTRRLNAMTARLIANDVEVSMALAGKLASKGNYAEAVKTLLPLTRSEGPGTTTGRIMLSLLQLRAGAPAFAAQYLHEAAMKDLGVFENDALESLVNSIRLALAGGGERRRGGGRGSLSAEDGRRMLRDLRSRYPDDPLVALAELELSGAKDGERGRRARGMLAQLQRVAGERPLDALRPGSTKAWVRFLSNIAPDVASELLRREFIKEPGNIDLFQLTGEIARVEGDLERARHEYETLLAIEPRADVYYALAEVLLEGGAMRPVIDPLLAKANRLAGAAEARSSFLRSLAELNTPRVLPLTPGQLERFSAGRIRSHESRAASERRMLDGLVQRLRTLWRTREGSAEVVDTAELGLAYASALSWRGTAEDDAAVLALVSELRPLVANRRYVPVLLETLASVSRNAARARSGS